MGKYDGRVFWDDATSEAHCILMLSCGIEDLVKYVDDSIPAIRSEIFSGLAQKTSDVNLLSEILNKHANDTSEYIGSRTDVVVTWTVSEYMQRVFDAKSNNELNIVDFQARLDQIRSQSKIVIPGVWHGYVTKESLMSMDSLVCSVEGSTVISFTLYARKRITSKDNKITYRMKRHLKKLDHGEKFYFEDLKVDMPDKTSRKLAPIVLKIG